MDEAINAILNIKIAADKEFSQRSGTVNFGREYEYLIPALFGLRCMFIDDIKDMWLASNVDGLGAFDDLLLHVEYTNGKTKMYIIQLKHKIKPIKQSSFTDAKHNDYYLHKYEQDFMVIQQHCRDNREILKNIQIQDVTFLIYTTSDFAQPCEQIKIDKLDLTLKKHLDVEDRKLLNTSTDCEKYSYKFFANNSQATHIDATFLDSFYLYTKQADFAAVESTIQQMINEKFNNNDANVTTNFINYVKNSTSGVGEKFYKLELSELKAKLTELLLSPYIVDPEPYAEPDNALLFHELIKNVDLTIIENDTKEMRTKIWSFINVLMKLYVEQHVESALQWEVPVQKKYQEQFYKTHSNHYLKHLALAQVGKKSRLTMKIIYLLLCNLGLIPLFVMAKTPEDQRHILKIVKLCQGRVYQSRFVLITNDRVDEKKLKPLKCLSNLSQSSAENLAKFLESTQVSLQGRTKNISLQKLVGKDPEVGELVSTELLVNMIFETRIIGAQIEELPEYYIHRSMRKIMFKPEVLDGVGDGSLFVVIALKQTWRRLRYFTHKDVTYMDAFLDGILYNAECQSRKDECKTAEIIFTNAERMYADTFKLICGIDEENEMGRNVHCFKFHEDGDNFLEWLKSKGSVEALKPYLCEKFPEDPDFYVNDKDEEEIWEYFENPVNVLCATAGMGKSVEMRKLAKKFPLEFWVFIVNLPTRLDDLKSIPFHLDIFEELYKSLEKNSDAFSMRVYAKFARDKKVVVFLDGFDEVIYQDKEVAIKLIKKLKKRGVKVWVAIRPSKITLPKDELFDMNDLFSVGVLLKKLNVFAFTLGYFTSEKQVQFVSEYSSFASNNLEKTEELVDNFREVCYNFVFAPLHLKMVIDIYHKENITTFYEPMYQVELYDKFIQNDILNYMNNVDDVLFKHNLVKYETLYSECALTWIYPIEEIRSLINFQHITVFLDNYFANAANLGVLCGRNQSWQPVFSHHTFAEYLVAKWLSKNYIRLDSMEFLSAFAKEDLAGVYYFFAGILAKENRLEVFLKQHLPMNI